MVVILTQRDSPMLGNPHSGTKSPLSKALFDPFVKGKKLLTSRSDVVGQMLHLLCGKQAEAVCQINNDKGLLMWRSASGKGKGRTL